MEFELTKSREILERTPDVLTVLLKDLSTEWTSNNEGGDTWTAFDVVGHLIHGEKKDWIERLEIILSFKDDKTFESFDRFAQFRESEGKTMNELLEEFKKLRKNNLQHLASKDLNDKHFLKKGIHPVFGEVSLSQLLSTWAVHDLNHISQITRVIAKQYKDAVGPWVNYLRILKS